MWSTPTVIVIAILAVFVGAVVGALVWIEDDEPAVAENQQQE